MIVIYRHSYLITSETGAITLHEDRDPKGISIVFGCTEWVIKTKYIVIEKNYGRTSAYSQLHTYSSPAVAPEVDDQAREVSLEIVSWP